MRSASTAEVRSLSLMEIDHDLAVRVGQRVRQLRTKRGLTQGELALRMGLRGFKREHVTRLEAGTHLPRLDLLVHVARALDVTLSKLLSRMGEVRRG